MVVGRYSVLGRCLSELSWFRNATAGKWRKAPSVPTRQFGACMTLVPGADILLLLGGQVTSSQTMNRPNVTGVSFLRQGTRNWYQLAGLRGTNVTLNRFGSNLVVLNNPLRFVMFGRRETASEQRLVESTNVIMFDPREVQKQIPLPKIRYTTVLDVHGFHMFGAFGIGFPVGLYIARLFRFFTQRHTWFVLHYGTQVFSLVLAVFGGVAVISATPGSSLDHPHAVIGVVVFALVTLQIQFTIPCVKPNVTADTKCELWEVPHRWMGRMIVAMGLVTCTLGMLLYVLPPWAMICQTLYSVLLFLGVLATELYHFSLRWRKQTAYQAYDENSDELAKKGTFGHEVSQVQYGLDWYPA